MTTPASVQLDTNLPQFFNELADIVRVFYPEARISQSEGEWLLQHRHQVQCGCFEETVCAPGSAPLCYREPAISGGLLEKRTLKRAAKIALFRLLRQESGIHPPWGSLTGIRPTRLMYEALADGLSLPEAQARMVERYDVQPERAALLSEILGMQHGLIEHGGDEFDLYIGIPFCTTRCDYCSFSSGTLGDGKLVGPYIDALIQEMRGAARIAQSLGLRLRAGYMGGGTPTALSADQLSSVLSEAMALFPGAAEWTVEAGRPDTIDEAKLVALKELGVTRISINPQSFSDETLALIGRAHTAEQTVSAFQLARECGFDNINMDLIAALPGEDEADFARSLDKAASLGPESVTVHTLALKHGSRMREVGYAAASADTARQAVDTARSRLAEAGYSPYYLYRQKYMQGNLENVGYAKPHRACLYNIDIMEETCSILALGAGAITKWLFPGRSLRIERAPNVKNIDQYIARVGEMVLRKRKLIIPNEEE